MKTHKPIGKIILFGIIFLILASCTAIMVPSAFNVVTGKTYDGVIVNAGSGFRSRAYGVQLSNGETVRVVVQCVRIRYGESCNSVGTKAVGEQVQVKVGRDGSTDFVGFGRSGTSVTIVAVMLITLTLLTLKLLVGYFRAS